MNNVINNFVIFYEEKMPIPNNLYFQFVALFRDAEIQWQILLKKVGCFFLLRNCFVQIALVTFISVKYTISVENFNREDMKANHVLHTQYGQMSSI